MQKQFYFLCGLPRCGSTVLTSILSQNPELYASPNSALVELLVNVRNHLRTTEQARAFMQPSQEKDVLIGIMEGMYHFTTKPNILDKSRAWPHPNNIRLLNDILPEPPKFIAVVRDLPAVLASFIKLIESNPRTTSYVDKVLYKQRIPLTTENRCKVLFSPEGTVYESWYSLKMAYDAGFEHLFHLVEYDELVTRPTEVLAEVYDFLKIPQFVHTFSEIVNQTPEDDTVYNIPGMHEVRPMLSKTSPDAENVLGKELYAKYAAVPHFWRKGASQTKKPANNPFTLKTRHV